MAVAAASSSGMSQQSGRPPGQQAAAAAAQQLRYGAATPPVGQQFQTNNNAWANSQLVPLQHGRVSPGPGQPVIAAAAAGQQALQQLQLAQYLQSQGLIAPGTAVTAQQLQALFQRQQQQAQAQAHMARAAQQQQQANQAGKRPVAVPAAAAAAPQAAAKKHIPLATVGSAGSLPALVQHGSNQQATARLGAAQNLAAVAGVGQRPLQAGGLAMQGIRPGVSIPAAPGVLGVAAAGLLGAPGIAQQAVQTHATLEARQHMAQLKPGEQPRLQLPDTHEWVQCLGKDGQPIWAALPRVGAQKYRAEQKRKADEAAGLQPAAKVAAVAGAGGAVRRRIDDDYTAGAGDRALDVMADDDLQAELAVNEAAKGAVQVQQGNVQVRAGCARPCLHCRSGLPHLCNEQPALQALHYTSGPSASAPDSMVAGLMLLSVPALISRTQRTASFACSHLGWFQRSVRLLYCTAGGVHPESGAHPAVDCCHCQEAWCAAGQRGPLRLPFTRC